VEVAVIATDVDNDVLTYSAIGLPQSLSISSTTGQIAGTVTPAGTYDVTVIVSDNNGGTDSTSFTWLVKAAFVNTAPEITSPGNQNNTEGDTVSLNITASDIDNDTLTFSQTGLPAGLSLNSGTGVISGSPTAANTFNVTLSVDDNNGGTDSTNFTWIVDAATPPPPVDTNPVSRSSSFTYNGNGQILTIDGPRTDVNDITTFEYDVQGNRTKTINALGQETHFTAYDASGRLLSMTDPNGVITQLNYDPRGRLLSRIVAGITTNFEYDGVGQLTKITLPNNAELNYTYDGARRLTDIEDNLGNRIGYTLDNMGNRTGEAIFDDTNTLRRSQTRVFDELSRLIESISADGRSTTFAYDPNGNQTNSADALIRSSSSAFDALDRLISSQDPDSQSTQYGYDAQDNLVTVTDARGLTTTYTYNGLGNLLTLNSPDTGITSYAYDAVGNRISQTDARDRLSLRCIKPTHHC
ncbi:MAG: putative Ig domain-containing protein, partial [Pseudomonadales bacterium]|nr:putative Ig domain-containing protein [Pseudomonadales bacterium]